jgi:hypothetical protein
MAKEIERRLITQIPEVNSTQIVVEIDLDSSYNGTIRNIVWSCYEGDENGDLIDKTSTTIPNKTTTCSNVFSNLTPQTTYYITAFVTNIEGYPYDILYYGTRTTDKSGGSDYVDPDEGWIIPPVITELSAYQLMIGYTTVVFRIEATDISLGRQDYGTYTEIDICSLDGEIAYHFTYYDAVHSSSLDGIGDITASPSGDVIELTTMIGEPFGKRDFYVKLTNHWIYSEFDEETGDFVSETRGQRSTQSYITIELQDIFKTCPLINDFTVQSIDDKGTIRVYCKFEGVYDNGIGSTEGWTDFKIYIDGQDHDICSFVLSECSNELITDGYTYIYEAEIANAGTPGKTYTYACVITNSYQAEAGIQEYECSPMFVTITLYDEIKCELPFYMAGSGMIDEEYSYDNGRVQFRVTYKPVIMAADWNRFCDDVNAVRRMSGYSDKITDIYVEKRDLMTASLFNKLYKAIADIYLEGFGLPEMPDNTFIQTGYKTDDLDIFIPRLCDVLLGLRDYYQSTLTD